MLYLGASNDYNVYVVRIPSQQVGVTGAYYFWFISPLGALAKDSPDPSINMTHDKFNYADPHLKLAEHSAMFETLKGQTIHAKW